VRRPLLSAATRAFIAAVKASGRAARMTVKAAGKTGRFAAKAGRYAAQKTANVLYSDTMKAKVAQGSTELASMLYQQSPAYSPVTAEKAADRVERAEDRAQRMTNNAHRAKFQQRSQARGMER
jgi:hypothetical protein